MAKITFLGGADEVGASCSLLEMAGRRIVVDCGIRMGASAERLPDLSLLPHDQPIDAIFLTHAHMDHCGALPLLHQTYPTIPIYMTAATLAITTTLLLDSLKIMAIEAQEGEIPLYPETAVESLLDRVRPVSLGKPLSLFGGEIQATFYPVGHILGATGIFFESKEATAFLSGDISITDQLTIPGMKLPPISTPDLMLVESTYGGRLHANRKAEEKRIVEQAREIIERKGIMLFPAFAVGRAQEVILILSRAMEKKELPTAPIFVDGMVKSVCQAYRSYPELLTPWMQKRCKNLGNPFFYDGGPVRPVWDPKVRAQVAKTRPAIIVSSSGMLTGGPSQAYARILASNPADFIAITGYQDEEAPGRQIQEVARAGGGSIRLGGDEIQLSCGVGTYSLSAHADTAQIVSLLSSLKPRRIALVHGDKNARPALQEAILQAKLHDVHLPACGTILPFGSPSSSKTSSSKASTPVAPSSSPASPAPTAPTSSAPVAPAPSTAPTSSAPAEPAPSTAPASTPKTSTPKTSKTSGKAGTAKTSKTRKTATAVESSTTTEIPPVTASASIENAPVTASTSVENLPATASPTKQTRAAIQTLERSDDLSSLPTLLPQIEGAELAEPTDERDSSDGDTPHEEEEAWPAPPERSLQDLEALEATELAAYLYGIKKHGQAISLPEILALWGYHGDLSEDLRKRLIERFSAKDSPLTPDKANPFLWRLRTLSGGGLWSADLAARRKEARSTPQEEILRLVDETFGDLNPYKRGLRLSIPEVVLFFHFPDIQAPPAKARIPAFVEKTGWRVRIQENPHQEALFLAAQKILPPGVTVAKISIHQNERRLVLTLAVTDPGPSEDALADFRAQTGFTLDIARAFGVGTSHPPTPGPLAPLPSASSTSALPAAPTTPPTVPPSPLSPSSPSSSIGPLPPVASAPSPASPSSSVGALPPVALAPSPLLQNSSALIPMEINQAFGMIRSVFLSYADQPSKVSLKNDEKGRYIELTFMTPQIGGRYTKVFSELTGQIGWRLKCRPTPDQNALIAYLTSKIPPEWGLQKPPSLHVQHAAFSLQLAFPPPPPVFAIWRDVIFEACGYRLL